MPTIENKYLIWDAYDCVTHHLDGRRKKEEFLMKLEERVA